VLRFQGGHTPGDVMVWLPQSGVIPVSVARDWLSSFRAMEQLAPKIIVPGHGQICDLAKAQRETRDYLALLLTEIRKRIDAGEDLQTTVETLDQSAFAYLANYGDLNGTNANRVYLELEMEF
jgi:glyoxylase-like metal-dependent hydrolase (beta-lactamase superfamily II)